MASKKSVRTDRGERLSSVVAGDTRRYGGGRVTRSDFAGNLQQGYGGGGLGMPVTNLGANIKQTKIQSRIPTQRSIGGMKAYGIAPGGRGAKKYGSAIGPSNRGVVPGGAGVVGLTDTRLTPTARAPKATVSGVAAAKKAAAKPARKATPINIPGGGLRVGTKAKSSRPLTASEARSLAPGNYRSGKVTMGGKTYTGFTVSSRTDSKGRTTKSVGNWTSTKDAGRSANSKGSFGMGAPKGSLFGGGSKSSGGGRFGRGSSSGKP